MTLAENVVLTHHRAEGSRRGWIGGWIGGWIDCDRPAGWAARIRRAFDVRAGAADPPAGSLSGGNLQKFVVGREILRRPACWWSASRHGASTPARRR